MKGLVTKSTGSWYTVRTEDGKYTEARMKGKLRLKGVKTTNPIAVGDKVMIEKQEDGHLAITEILPRENYIIRKSINLSKQTHIIAANLDQAFLVITLKEPFTPLGFIDRFILTAEAYHVKVILVFNKMDIYTESERQALESFIHIYENLGYQCLRFSSKEGNAEVLRELLKDKTTLISGHSGVGKSTLINMVQPGLNLKTSEISEYHSKGTHTTTFYEMFELSFGGFIIDTPGIKGFGVVEIDKSEISHYFVEMRALLPQCRFNNCTHIEEPGCAVKEAVEDGRIAPHRYKNYLSIYFNTEEEEENEFK